MIKKITGIHGTSSGVTFECENTLITGSGEFIAKDGEIAGFVVSKASLRFENGEWLTPDEQEELIRRYKKYAGRRSAGEKRNRNIEFD